MLLKVHGWLCVARAHTAPGTGRSLDCDAETLLLSPATVAAETCFGSLVKSSVTVLPTPAAWRIAEDGLALVGASPFTDTTRSPTWLGLGLGFGFGFG